MVFKRAIYALLFLPKLILVAPLYWICTGEGFFASDLRYWPMSNGDNVGW
jgi:hypothetical protein